MQSDPSPSAHRALLNLERSSAPAAELLDEAARILGIEFDAIKDELLQVSEGSFSGNSIRFAPVEEWILRWLLKKTKSTEKSTSPDSASESSANSNPRKWMLFYYLVRRTPIKKVAKTLREQDGMRQIQDALTQVHAAQKISRSRTAMSSLHEADYDVPPGPSKKRKRSPEPGSSAETDSSNLVTLSVLHAMKVCRNEASTGNEEDVIAQQHIRIALSLPPEKAAALLAHAIRNVNFALEAMSESKWQDSLLHSLDDSMSLWELRHDSDLGDASGESDRLFTFHCLLPCLHVLMLIRQRERPEQHSSLTARLEKLIALHAVEPVRRVFFDELAAKWQGGQDPLLPEHMKPAVEQLLRFLFPSCNAVSDDTEDTGSILVLVAPILFEIAIRSCPSSAVRKLQHEQPWLEALLVCLAHMGGCSLVDSGEALPRQPGSPGFSVLRMTQHSRPASLTCLERLLSTAYDWKVSISLPLLGLLTQIFASLHPDSLTNWALLTAIIQLDVNVFLPNSGMSTAEGLLARLIASLHEESGFVRFGSNMPSDHQSHVEVLKSLMNGLATARDVGTFVKIWMDRLAAIEESRTSQFRLGDSTQLYSLWEDEDIIAEFSRIAKTFTTPAFIESHLLATTQALSDDEYNGRHYGPVVVLDAIVKARPEDIGAEESLLKKLRDRIQKAIFAVKPFGKLAGWLWRLLRRILPLVGRDFPSILFKSLLDGEERAIIEVTLHCIKESTGSLSASVRCFNEVERFHCLISMMALGFSAAEQHLEVEMKVLTTHIAEILAGDELDQSVEVSFRSDHATNLGKGPEVVIAFLGILLQNTQVLCTNIDSTVDLLKVMASAKNGTVSSKAECRLASIFDALLLDEALVGTPGFVKKCIEAAGLLDQSGVIARKLNNVQALPREAMSKSQRQKLVKWQGKFIAGSQKKQLSETDLEDAAGGFQKDQKAISLSEDSGMSFGDMQRSCRSARATIGSQPNITCLIEELRRDEFLSPERLLLFGSMLHQRGTISPYVTQIAADLSALLPKSQNVDNFCLTADCIKIILDKYHDSVNQWTIDNLLACIAITLSVQGPHIPSAAPILFERLCRLIGFVLSRYRVRLGGRYHLLLSVLNKLLRCFFTPDPATLTTESQAEFLSSLPPWIICSRTKLSQDSSTHLTRLLTSICNPTPSSVKKANNKNSLTDDTKKARKIAGEYMQYFIAEYAHCQLNGRVEVEAKEGLMPGLYAVVDAMNMEVMRAMNARMNKSQRAIWKSLYDDWRRFGRWNGM